MRRLTSGKMKGPRNIKPPTPPQNKNNSPTKDLDLLRYRGRLLENDGHMRDGVWGDLQNKKQVMQRETHGKEKKKKHVRTK